MLVVQGRKSGIMTIGKIDISESLKCVEALLKEDKTSSPQMRATMELLVLIINLLLEKLGVNSTNSSKPPSQDPNRKRGSRRKVTGVKRKPGGQPGHPGKQLEMVKDPDEIFDLEIDRRTLPPGQYSSNGFERRQVIDIKISRHVTEYRAEVLSNASGAQFVAEFPPEATRPAQYGSDLKAMSVYMSQQQLIPYDRVLDYFSDQCRIAISEGSVFNFNQRAYELLEAFELVARTRLINSGVLHADETGINISGKRLWLHYAGSSKWTLYFPHAKRGGEAMKAMGVLDDFRGILCHDHWKAYFAFLCSHSLCNAHHLRELERAWDDYNQSWAKKMKSLLLAINNCIKKSTGSLPEGSVEDFLERYRKIIKDGERECPGPAADTAKPKRGRIKRTVPRNLLERLKNFEAETLRFMTDSRVPFTNNQGENDIRMTKVQQKISGCFRSMEGAKIFCRIRSYLSTCRKNGIPPTEALKMLFAGKLPEIIARLE